MTLDGLNKTLLASYHWHQYAFMLGVAVMMVVDFFYLEGWATFWLLAGWSLVFGVHFMVYQSQAVDEEWVREKIIFEVYRPWDHGHVDEIKNNPYGKSIYRTELGRVDKDGKPVKSKDDEPAKDA